MTGPGGNGNGNIHHQIVIRSPTPSPARRQPLLTPPQSHKSTPSAGEVAGDTIAVCCCCPCVLLECLVLAVYKVPYTVLRRLWRTRMQKKKKKLLADDIKRRDNALLSHAMGLADTNTTTTSPGHVVVNSNFQYSLTGSRRKFYYPSYYCDELSDVDFNKEFETVKVSIDGSAEAVQLDKEMWDRFDGTGFWRSPSMRNNNNA